MYNIFDRGKTFSANKIKQMNRWMCFFFTRRVTKKRLDETRDDQIERVLFCFHLKAISRRSPHAIR